MVGGLISLPGVRRFPAARGLLFSLACFYALINPAKGLAREPQKWALLVGVDDYTSLKKLRYAGADQRALAAGLGKSGFPADQVVMLSDQAAEKRFLPFRQNILRELELLLKLARRDDTLIVGFSGHGVRIGQRNYICPSEANFSDPAGTMLPVDGEGGLFAMLQNCPATLKLLLLDACRSDPWLDGERAPSQPDLAGEFAAELKRRPPAGLLLLTSCGERQKAMEDEQLGHGVFMHFLLEGLHGEAANREGIVTLSGLYDYASFKTEKHVARKFGGYQTPGLEGKIDGTFEICRVDRSAPPPPESSRPAPPPAERPGEIKSGEVITNSIGMKLVGIPAGEFRMGSDEDPDALVKESKVPGAKRDWFDSEAPRHKVRITRAFYLGQHEVRKRDFSEFVTATDYQTEAEKDGKGGWGYTGKADQPVAQKAEYTWRNWGVNQSDDSPVVNVSWNDAEAFCAWLSQKEGKTYRLPTEAEWEYACRAGTTTRYSTGDSDDSLRGAANIADATLKRLIPAVSWCQDWDDGRALTGPVGELRANQFGLYDMHGNVLEWCSDWYDKHYYGASPVDDPGGPAGGSYRVFRGGSWSSTPRGCRSAGRSGGVPSYRYFNLGFRVACSPR